MDTIRPATIADLSRIAELIIFNYRLNFYPIFREDYFYFGELQVSKQMELYKNKLDTIWVYDDGVVKGFIQVEGQEVKKLFVEHVLQGNSIGSTLLEYAMTQLRVVFLWALEKNERAIKFYKRHGFKLTGEKKLEEDTTEYLVRMDFCKVLEQRKQ